MRSTDLGQDLVRDLHVRVHLLHVVEVVEHFEQPHDPPGAVGIERDARGRAHRHLRALRLHPARGDAVVNVAERLGAGDHVERAVVVRDHVLCAGVERRLHQALLVGSGRERELTDLGEQVGHRAAGAETPPALRERVADLRDGAVAIVGDTVHHHCGAAGTVALVAHFFEGICAGFAGRAPDGPVHGVLRHVAGERLVNRESETGIGAGVATAFTRGDGDFADELGEQLAAPGVLGLLAVLDVRPLGMACHRGCGGCRAKSGFYHYRRNRHGRSNRHQNGSPGAAPDGGAGCPARHARVARAGRGPVGHDARERRHRHRRAPDRGRCAGGGLRARRGRRHVGMRAARADPAHGARQPGDRAPRGDDGRRLGGMPERPGPARGGPALHPHQVRGIRRVREPRGARGRGLPRAGGAARVRPPRRCALSVAHSRHVDVRLRRGAGRRGLTRVRRDRPEHAVGKSDRHGPLRPRSLGSRPRPVAESNRSRDFDLARVGRDRERRRRSAGALDEPVCTFGRP